MIVRRRGGMTEFIPSPKEKREGLIHDHVLELVNLLHLRLRRIEKVHGASMEAAERCRHLLERIRSEERQTLEVNRRLAEEDE